MPMTPLPACVLLVLASTAVAQDAAPNYERDIAPILRSYCSGCHNDKDIEGKLSVETYAQLLKGGEDHAEPVKPGDADGSFLIRSIEGKEKRCCTPQTEK